MRRLQVDADALAAQEDVENGAAGVGVGHAHVDLMSEVMRKGWKMEGKDGRQ